ncbi:MAG: ABC transporter substrate-binding protein [Candidatus Latescibacteria bacterium]|nr:ABC transporter substrate-binding protein [Candidatus Latescibacterota bacterium]
MVLNVRFWIRLICCIGICVAAIPVGAQLSLQYAEGFRVDYFEGYKVVTVVVPGTETGETLRYILVQRGSESPDGFEGVPRIRIPVRTMITTSTTHLPHIEKLDEIRSLVAVDNVKFVNSEAVRQRFAEGGISEVGRGRSIDLERVLVLRPDVVVIDAPSQDNAYHSLRQAGVAAVVNAAYAEPTLLGRVEWLKFAGVFFNKENLAAALFDSIAARYDARKSLTANLQPDRKPTVFVGSQWRGTWFMSGGRTFAAQLLEDAGANYLWGDNESRRSLTLDFESVYEKAHDADIWITMRNEWQSIGNVVAEDERYGQFKAVETSRVFNANARLNENGGNDYWETGLIEPDVLLADIIKILYPDLQPDHQLKYYRKLDP